MNINQLEYLRELIKEGSYIKAAKKLYISQPALSKAIKNLEDELETELFYRDGKSVRLTSAGEIFYRYVENSLRELEKGREKLKEINGKGIIKIASTPNVGLYFTPHLIGEYLQEEKDSKIQFYQFTDDEYLDRMKNKKIDIFLFDSEDKKILSSGLNYVPIKKEQYILIVSKKHRLSGRKKVSLKELKDESFISTCEITEDRGEFYKNLFGKIPKIAIKPDNFNGYEQLVASGAGVALIPKTPYINRELVSVIELEEKFKERIIYMGWRDREKNRKIIEFVLKRSGIR